MARKSTEGKAELREAMLYEELANKRVRCLLCPRYCTIGDGALGWCAVRINRGGKLYTFTWGKSTGFAIDPIEKKPFYHFKPGTFALSFGTPGCNQRCLYCQNWFMSQAPKEVERAFEIPTTTPEGVAQAAMQAHGVAYTYSEPTIFFEYARDCVHATRKLEQSTGAAPRYHVWVTNGYFSAETWDVIRRERLVDAMRIDLKSFREDFYREIVGSSLQPVLESIKRVHSSDVHLEVIVLIIPTKNDSDEELREMARWVTSLSRDIPIHYLRFFPYYKLSNLHPTPEATLLRAREIAREEGARYVYIGNTFLEGVEDTRCPSCNTLLVSRRAMSVLVNRIVDKRPHCPQCGESIKIVL